MPTLIPQSTVLSLARDAAKIYSAKYRRRWTADEVLGAAWEGVQHAVDGFDATKASTPNFDNAFRSYALKVAERYIWRFVNHHAGMDKHGQAFIGPHVTHLDSLRSGGESGANHERIADPRAVDPTELTDAQAQDILINAIENTRLANRERQVIYLRLISHMTNKEAAATLGITAGAAKKSCNLARGKVRDHLRRRTTVLEME